MKYTTDQLLHLKSLVRHRVVVNQDKAPLDDIQLEQAFLWMLYEKINEELNNE